MEYNTLRQPLTLKEYGRGIQQMVKNLKQVEDREKRNVQAQALIEVMRQFIQPGTKDNVDLNNKVWDDLYIMADFDLDVDSPFEKPDKSILFKKPQHIGYASGNPRSKHFGKNIEMLVAKIVEMPEGEDKEMAVLYLGRTMKSFYHFYNKETLEDHVVADQIKFLSNGKLRPDIEKIKAEGLYDTGITRERTPNFQGGFQRNTYSQDRRNNNPSRNNNRNNNNPNPNRNHRDSRDMRDKRRK